MDISDKSYGDSFFEPWHKLVFDKIYFFLKDKENSFDARNKKVFDAEPLSEKFINFIGLCSHFMPSMKEGAYLSENESNLFDSKTENYLSRRKLEKICKKNVGEMDVGDENIKLEDSYKTFLDGLLNDLWDRNTLVYFDLMANCHEHGLTPHEFAEKLPKGETYLCNNFSFGIKHASRDPRFSLSDIANSVTGYMKRASDSML